MDFYHVLNRGVTGQDIFRHSGDYVRFIHDLYEFNDDHLAENSRRKMNGFVNPSFNGKKREKIVDVHAWVLMKNHYHLLLSERREGGMAFFMRKLNVGYANYFNTKYERSGYVFQGRTKKILIERDAHFMHIVHYIHLNPLDYQSGSRNWRAREVNNTQTAFAYLSRYRWSSYIDYCGEKNFPSLLTKDFFDDALGNVEKATHRYLKEIEIKDLAPLILE